MIGGAPGRIARGLGPASWLVVDALPAALVASWAETLLLFVLSPEIPLTLPGFVATWWALAPQIVALFVLAGPALVLFGMALAVSRTTRRGLSLRYVLRFALLDAVLLSAACAWQWGRIGSLLPATARLCLALMMTTGLAAALGALVLVIVELRRPGRPGLPWLVALAAGTLVALGATASIRRIEFEPPRAVDIPGFAPRRPVLLVEIPALDPDDLGLYIERGYAEALGGLAEQGLLVRVTEPRATDPIALHATLITGKPAREHGVLGSVRYRPSRSRRSFGILPRGLLLRPLLWTPLWERVPVDRQVVRTVALPQIARGLGVPMARIGDPLGWRAGPGEIAIPESRLVAGARFQVGDEVLACPAPRDVRGRFFDPPADELPATDRLETIVAEALAQDACALRVARAVVARGQWPIVWVRLAGHYRVAWEFAGWREDRPARGATQEEIRAWGLTLTRYVRELDPLLGDLFAAAPTEELVLVVSPHGIRQRTDFERLLASLVGRTAPTGTHRGPPDGLVLLRGEGVVAGHRLDGFPVRSVLPTLLWAAGLPTAEDMGPLITAAFDDRFRGSHPVIAVPGFEARAAEPGSAGSGRGEMLE